MRVLFIMEMGIPEYRNFLFERLNNDENISELLVLHNGQIYNAEGNYPSKKLKFVGNNKFGFHIGLLAYLFKYDVIVSSYNLRILSCWLPIFFKKKWIFWGKGLGNNESQLVLILRKLTARKAKAILVYNEFKKQEIVNRLKIDHAKVIAYQNTIEVNNPELSTESDKEYFLYFGRIQERKGLEILINEYFKYIESRIQKNLKVHKLRIVGDGTYKEHLISLVKGLKIQQYVHFFKGAYDDECIKGHFKHAVCYVSPYNVGLAVINSFAYGVPVITCRKPQVGPEFNYLNNNNSFILESADTLNIIMDKLSDDNLSLMNLYCYDYYKNSLTTNVMFDNFINTIKHVGKNE